MHEDGISLEKKSLPRTPNNDNDKHNDQHNLCHAADNTHYHHCAGDRRDMSNEE